MSLGYCLGMDGIYGVSGEDVLNAVLPYLFSSLVLYEIYFLMCGELEMQITVTIMQRRWDY